jgi:hypothetical protein
LKLEWWDSPLVQEEKYQVKPVKKKNNNNNKCARISLKNGTVYRKQHIGNTMENEIKELKPIKANEYFGVEENHSIEHKNEKEKLKKECVRRLRLILITQLSAQNKMQTVGSLCISIKI